MKRLDTETHCHCGKSYDGSDHCPWCNCEMFEGYCNEDYPDLSPSLFLTTELERIVMSGIPPYAEGHFTMEQVEQELKERSI
jgi:hypothetical protein